MTQPTVALCSVVFLGVVLCMSFPDSLQNMKHNSLEQGRSAGWYNRAVFSAGEALAKAPGIQPGDNIACLGEAACRDDFYWARLAQVHIRTEIFADTGTANKSAMQVWREADKDKVYAALRSTGVKAIVADFGPEADPPAEWKRLGTGKYYVIYL